MCFKIFTTQIKCLGCIIPPSVGYTIPWVCGMCGIINAITINPVELYMYKKYLFTISPVKQTGPMFLCHCHCLFQFSLSHFVKASKNGFVGMYSKDKFLCLFLYLCISPLVGLVFCYGVVWMRSLTELVASLSSLKFFMAFRYLW